MTSTEASKKKNENKVFLNLYRELLTERINKMHKYSLGDKVRISKKNFEKGYTPRWTEEIFTISALQYTTPPTYKIKDYNNEEIRGTFYEPELHKSTQ